MATLNRKCSSAAEKIVCIYKRRHCAPVPASITSAGNSHDLVLHGSIIPHVNGRYHNTMLLIAHCHTQGDKYKGVIDYLGNMKNRILSIKLITIDFPAQPTRRTQGEVTRERLSKPEVKVRKR